MSSCYPLQQAHFVLSQLAVPHVYNQDDASAVAQIPHLMHKAVIKHDAPTLFPGAVDPVNSKTTLIGDFNTKMAAKPHVCWSVVRCDSGSRLKAGKIANPGKMCDSLVRVDYGCRYWEEVADFLLLVAVVV